MSAAAPSRDLAVVDAEAQGGGTGLGLAAPSWTREDLVALKQTVGVNLTDAEFRVFLAAARRLGLDPFARQIYALKLDNRMTPQVSIDGFRLIAERTGKYAGQLGPYWCGADGAWHEVWLAAEAPLAAKVGVLRRDFDQPMWGVARYRSYARSTSTWSKLPDVMLAKVAESLALRRAFPNELSGVYIPEEMEQARLEEREEQETPAERASVTVTAQESRDARPPAEERQSLTLASLYDRSRRLGVSAKVWQEIKRAAGSDLGTIAAQLDAYERAAAPNAADAPDAPPDDQAESGNDTRNDPAAATTAAAAADDATHAPTAEQLAEIEYLCLLLDLPQPNPDTAEQAELNLRSLRRKARETGHEIADDGDSGASASEPVVEHDLRGLGTGKAARH